MIKQALKHSFERGNSHLGPDPAKHLKMLIFHVKITNWIWTELTYLG